MCRTPPARTPHTPLFRAALVPADLSGDPAQTPRLRADLRTDLAGLDGDLIDTVALCAGEAFANATEHTRSGDPDGRVVRALHSPAPGRLRLTIVDDGAPNTAPRIPHQRTAHEWETAEHGRGLLLIAALTTAWGTFPTVAFPGCADLGTALWAEFPLTTGAETTR